MTTTTTARTDLTTRWKVRRFQRLLDHHTDPLINRFGATEATAMRRAMLDEYRTLLPQVPYIGGRRNPLTPALAMSAWAVAIYRVVLRHGGDAQDAADVLHGYLQTMVGRIPTAAVPGLRPPPGPGRADGPAQPAAPVPRRLGRPDRRRHRPTLRLRHRLDRMRRREVTSRPGAQDFTPYICAMDYLTAQAAGERLARTKTLSWGCDRCDFRFTHPGTTTATWPLDFPGTHLRPAPTREEPTSITPPPSPPKALSTGFWRSR